MSDIVGHMLGNLLQWNRPCVNICSWFPLIFLWCGFRRVKELSEVVELDRYYHLVAWSVFSMMPSYFSSFVLVTMSAPLEQEMWLKDAVLAVFPDTRDCSPSLVRLIIMDSHAD